MRKKLLTMVSVLLILTGAKAGTSMKKTIDPSIIEQVQSALIEKHGASEQFRIDRGVLQAASLWREIDGGEKDFEAFCLHHFVAQGPDLDKMFNRISRNMELLWGKFHEIDVLLKEPLHLSGPPVSDIDMIFGSFNTMSHLTEDLYRNKIGFITALNFPYYPLKEKEEKGREWTRKQWAYARLGDLFTARIPAGLKQEISSTLTAADTYISEYNIFMGKLVDENNNRPFPQSLKLITHWGLRDELKSQYANDDEGLENQKMIYAVMKRIIDQSIPTEVINQGKMSWNPYTNELVKDGKKVEGTPEPDERYATLLKNFRVMKKADAYYPNYESFIQRKFEGDYEITQADVEKLFTDFVSSPVIRETGKLIEKRLGRKLKPWDIWYDGFKARSGISEDELDKMVSERYPNPQAFEDGLPDMLIQLGFSNDKAQEIASKIVVDPARGAGHAWGAEMRSDVAHLRTRIGEDGMDYKGYNIAVHEFGHNVEQTITLHGVDYYMLNGVPNTAFTEALAFIFQKRDLNLLGIKENNPDKAHLQALDNLWSSYEIMGVSLVDMNVWKWMYANPDATKEELKTAVIHIAKEIWNKYYADVFGSTDEPILAVYSHMIDNPLYLSAYPLGHLIDFQIEKQLEGKDFADEVMRIYTKGRIIPQLWMQHAVGNSIAIGPTLEASEKALKAIK